MATTLHDELRHLKPAEKLEELSRRIAEHPHHYGFDNTLYQMQCERQLAERAVASGL